MRRRDFIAGVGGAVVWPVVARAQQGGAVRHVGILMNQSEDDPESKLRVAGFLETMRQLGWTVGGNLKVETRWTAGDRNRIRAYAAEMTALAPDVILASGGTVTRALAETGGKSAVVFVNVTDPVGGGMVASLARPDGNFTGFTQFEYGMSGKWLELLKEMAPNVRRVAVLRNPTNPGALGQLGAIQVVAPSFGVQVSPIDERETAEIERAMTAFAREPNGGVIVLTGTGGLTPRHRDLIITLAARHRMPGVYPYRYFVAAGGLLSYGPDTIDPYRRAATYVNRIFKGERPADLPVQAPTKFELVINLKSAKALSLTVPASLLARADEVIE